MRIEFKLSMPSNNSWNGKWSGEDKNYTAVRTIPKSRVKELKISESWRYDFGDGWAACVVARIMDKGERQKSDGFCGYEWMIDEIIRHGKIICEG